MNKGDFGLLRSIVKTLPKGLEKKERRKYIEKLKDFSIEESKNLDIEHIKKLIELSTKNIDEILEIVNTHGKYSYTAREFGLDYKIDFPDDTDVCEVEDYMRKLEIYFNGITKESKLISAFYVIGTGAIECLDKDENGISKSKRIREFDIEKYENIEGGVNIQDNIENGKKSIKFKFDLPGDRKEYVVMTFDLDIDNDIVLKHDLVKLLNILEGKNGAKLIEQMMNKKSHMYSDSMTGLKNSSYLKETLSKPGHNYSGVFIDIAEFKKINDENGQAFGDRAIQEVAKNLEFLVRPNDKVIRIGGDEFFILFENGNNSKEKIEENIKIFTDRLKDNLKLLHLESVDINLHVGYAVSTKDKSKSAIDLIIDANKNVVKDSAGKLYRKLDDFESLNPKEALEYIRLLFEKKSFTLQFFNVLTCDHTEIGDFFTGLNEKFKEIKDKLKKGGYNEKDLTELEEYIKYISILKNKERQELRDFFLNKNNKK